VEKLATVTLVEGMTFDADLEGTHVSLSTRGETGDNRGPTPMELLLAALGGCTAMDIVSILRKKRQPITGLTVRLRGQRADQHPHRYTRIEVVYEVQGEGVDRAAVQRAVELSDQRYCSVSATLREHTEITSRVEIV
jgi:putative redox protein